MAVIAHIPRRCEHCVHWAGSPDDEEANCRRFPPTVHFVPVRTLAGDSLAPVSFFPTTRKDITCSEFAPRNIIGD